MINIIIKYCGHKYLMPYKIEENWLTLLQVINQSSIWNLWSILTKSCPDNAVMLSRFPFKRKIEDLC